jgi:hypothetical protein
MIDPPVTAFEDVLESGLITLLRSLADNLSKEHGATGELYLNQGIHSSDVAFFPLDHWVTGLLFHFGALANGHAWRFDIRGSQAVQALAYGEGGHYTWHQDSCGLSEGGLIRKLSVMIPLSSPDEYEGGNFEILSTSGRDGEGQIVQVAEAAKPGSVVVFPAYVQHRVTRITRGFRRSLVAWLTGPPFK